MIILDVDQNGTEWYVARAGVFTSSDFSQIITSKGVKSKSLEKYILKTATQSILGTTDGGYNNFAMQWGHKWEPRARIDFAWEMGVDVRTPGFIFKDESRICGCSPDGDMPIWEKGLEIKCPEKPEIHAGYVLDGKLPAIYFHQVEGSMYVTGYQSWYFMSFYEGLPSLIIEVKRDEVFISALHEAIQEAAIQLAMTIKKLKSFN